MVVVNAVVIFRVGDTVQRDTDTLTGCLQLVRVADDLTSLCSDRLVLPQLAKLAVERPSRTGFRAAFRWLALLKAPLIDVVARLLNFAFLLELLAHAAAMRKFARLRQGLATSFRLVGEIDAAIAVASWLAYCPNHCRPTLADRVLLDVRDGCHPLLPDGVGNSLRLDGRSVLVTGSNMAGKTTFIKMLGVNVLLGQTLGFCIAAEATIPRCEVMASIQAAHSVASGKSHYFSEVETIRSFLTRQGQGRETVFVIDELFSGTNTVERVAIARAVLEVLGQRSLVLATTHDVELQTRLQADFDLCHFQEDPGVDGFFDYRLQTGPATERNAIRLLGEVGFPAPVIASAMAYARQDVASTTEVVGGPHGAPRRIPIGPGPAR